jgi:nucleotide-binding universal stress UspA family protein
LKTILVPTAGGDSDRTVFATALAAARPLASHLHFLHIHIGAGQAAANIPHADFAMGPALSNALAALETSADAHSAAAARHVAEFCARSKIEMRDTPDGGEFVTASWSAETGDALDQILFRARHHDLVVVGRAARPHGLPHDFIEQLLLGCGRPVLIANALPPQTLTGTIMVCWRETADAARAVTAATPLLAKAKRVFLTTVAERDGNVADGLNDLARQLAWSGVRAEVEIIAPNGMPISTLLAAAGDSHAADLMVLGAYGHSRAIETLFGGATQSFIQEADRPVMMMH